MKIRELAKRLNLSESTVSKALNNRDDVSDYTRELFKDFLLKNTIEKILSKGICHLVIIYGELDKNNYLHYIIILITGLNKRQSFIKSTKVRENDIKTHVNVLMNKNNYDVALIIGTNMDKWLYKNILYPELTIN